MGWVFDCWTLTFGFLMNYEPHFCDMANNILLKVFFINTFGDSFSSFFFITAGLGYSIELD